MPTGAVGASPSEASVRACVSASRSSVAWRRSNVELLTGSAVLSSSSSASARSSAGSSASIARTVSASASTIRVTAREYAWASGGSELGGVPRRRASASAAPSLRSSRTRSSEPPPMRCSSAMTSSSRPLSSPPPRPNGASIRRKPPDLAARSAPPRCVPRISEISVEGSTRDSYPTGRGALRQACAGAALGARTVHAPASGEAARPLCRRGIRSGRGGRFSEIVDERVVPDGLHPHLALGDGGVVHDPMVLLPGRRSRSQPRGFPCGNHLARWCGLALKHRARRPIDRMMEAQPSARDAALAARVETARAGVVLTLVAVVGLFAYIFLTWSEPNRGGLIAVASAGVATAMVPLLLGLERILDERWADLTWLTWSLAVIIANAFGVALDGGAHSPLVVVFALPLMFSALSYPRRIALIVCAVDLVACFASLTATEHRGAGFAELVLWILAGAAGLCIWQVNRQERQERRLAELSRTDSLTGVLNRRAFVERLQASVAEHTRHETPFALLVLDLDAFKLVNARHGHIAGDEVLQWTARIAAETLRPTDVLARLGGDEFAVLLGDVSPEETAVVHGRLLAALEERAPATAGYACCPEDGTDGDLLYRLADARLYDAKRASGQIAA